MNDHDAERSPQVAAILHRALELDPSARGAYLDRACAGDATLRAEVEALVAGSAKTDFLEQPATVLAAPLLTQWPGGAPGVLAGAALGPYRVVREIGRGGAATVYLAEDPRLRRQVAVKVLRPEIAASVWRRRFVREVELAARLQHPHIVPVFDSGDTDGRLWYAMPYVAGESLRDRLAREPQLPIAEAIRIAREVAFALDYAHRHDVIHRDIKPANILLADGQALVADFGIARALQADDDASLTESGLAIGTPAYMSPEQGTGDRPVDGRSDIYALGCVLYEMLAGEPPFTGRTIQAVLARRLTGSVPSLTTVRPVPPYLERAVTRALERSPADRFSTAHDFASGLDPPVADTTVPATPVSHHSRARGPGLRAGLLLLTLLAALAVGYAVHARRPPTLPAGDARSVGVAAGEHSAAATRSVAVLPLVNVGGDPRDEYFSDGLTDELAGACNMVPGLRVASRTSAFTFKGRKDMDVRAIGRALNVGAVLEGTVRRVGARVRISTQLTSADDGLTLWSNTYERDLKDIFQIQEEVATAVAAALRLTLGSQPGLTLAGDRTTSLEAHDLYLQGLFYLNRYTEPDLRRSLDLFQRALSHDSLYAPAFVGISMAWTYLADDWLAPTLAYPRAARAARRALQLDSTAAGAYVALALPLIYYERDFAGGEAALKRAIATHSDVDAHGTYGDYLGYRGRLGEAEVQLRQAFQLDPLSPGVHASLSRLFLAGGRLDEALDHGRRSVALDPSYASAHFALAEVYRQEGLFTEALVEYGRAQDLGFRAAQVGRALALARMGRATEARGIVRALEQESTRRYVAPDWIAVIYAGLGDREAAFRWLQRTLETPATVWVSWMDTPDWDPIRRDPRFDVFRRRMGLLP
jgi:serine/threonine-protein kinase